jgi:phytoene dehydrogenase-like protein
MIRETERRERADLVVVGGGVAGLTAAALAAREGRSVVVLERAARPGGRAATHVRDGVGFNLGPHALYRQGHAAGLLRELGVAVEGRVPDPGRAQLVGGDRAYRLPQGPGSLLVSRLLSAREKVRLVRFLAGLPRRDARALDRTPLADWVLREAGAGQLAALLRALFRVSTYADDQDRLSAGAAIDQLRTALAGNVLYLDGGWQSIVDGLRDRTVGDGAEIRAGARATLVEADDAGIAVRLADGGSVRGRVAVLAVDPGSAVRLLDLPQDGPLARWTAGRHPIRAACLDVALDRLPRPVDRFALGLDRPLYYSVHSASARLAQQGVAVVHVMKYLGGDNSGMEEGVEPELEEFLDRLQPGWRQHVRQRRFLPGMIVANALPEAATGGLAGRPGVEVPARPGVFLAGDWVGAEGMLADASAASAARAARLALASLARGCAEPRRSLSHAGS